MSLPADETCSPPHSDQSPDPSADAAGALGECLVCAEAFERTAGPSSDPEERIRAESESLLHWAENTGRVLSAAELGGLIEGFHRLSGSANHHAFGFTERLAPESSLTGLALADEGL